MRKAIVWYEMLLKDRLMRKATWIAAAVMLCFLAIVTEIHIPSSQNRIVGICSQKSGEKAAIVTDLYAQQGAFDYKEYTDATQLYEDVQTGKLECGFVLSDQLEKKLETGDPEKCVQYVVSPYSTKGEVAKETFFASFLRVYSEQILRQNEKNIFLKPDSERMKEILKANELFMQCDFFKLDQVSVEAKSKNRREGTCYPLQGLLGIFLLGFMYFANGRKFEPDGRWTGNCFTRREAILFSMMQTLSTVTMPAVAGMLLILQRSTLRPAQEEIVRVLFFLVIGVPWVTLYAKLARSQESFLAYGILLMAVCTLLYPVISDIAWYIPGVKYVRYLTPLGILL